MKKIILILTICAISLSTYSQRKLSDYVYDGNDKDNIQAIMGTMPIIINDTVTFSDFAFRRIEIDSAAVISVLRDVQKTNCIPQIKTGATTLTITSYFLIPCGRYKFRYLKVISGRVRIYP